MPKRCVECRGEGFSKIVAPLEREVSGRLFVGKAPALRCKECSLLYWQASSLIGFERRIGAVLASEGPATARTFQFLRKAIPLKALDLAALLHVSAETISRWENGKTHLDLGAWASLESHRIRTADRSSPRERGAGNREDVPVSPESDSLEGAGPCRAPSRLRRNNLAMGEREDTPRPWGVGNARADLSGASRGQHRNTRSVAEHRRSQDEARRPGSHPGGFRG